MRQGRDGAPGSLAGNASLPELLDGYDDLDAIPYRIDVHFLEGLLVDIEDHAAFNVVFPKDGSVLRHSIVLQPAGHVVVRPSMDPIQETATRIASTRQAFQ
jgi:hypothetical protein